jgi:hypothetical protein
VLQSTAILIPELSDFGKKYLDKAQFGLTNGAGRGEGSAAAEPMCSPNAFGSPQRCPQTTQVCPYTMQPSTQYCQNTTGSTSVK